MFNKFYKLYFFLIFAALILQSCMNYFEKNYQSRSEPIYFDIRFVDEGSQILRDVEIEYSIQDDHGFLRNNHKIFLNKGILVDSVLANPKYGAILYYKITKSGYCTQEGSVTNLKTSRSKEIIIYKKGNKYAKFEILVRGLDERPIEGVNIQYKLKSEENNQLEMAGSTSSYGTFMDSINYEGCKEKDNLGKLEINLSKEGYYPKDSSITIYSKGNNKISKALIARTDYFDQKFLRSNITPSLVKDITNFIDLIVINTYLTDNILQYYSIKVISFKNQNYLTFEFQDMNEYNLAKLNKYDIGKRIFDEAVRKILNPLNDYISESKEFIGYDLRFNTMARNFVDEKETSKKLVYEFYIPKKIVSSYKNLDITGQQVIDNSIILLDGERIDLKLQ